MVKMSSFIQGGTAEYILLINLAHHHLIYHRDRYSLHHHVSFSYLDDGFYHNSVTIYRFPCILL